MPRSLAPQAIERYRRDGVIFPIRALDATTALSYRQHLEAFEAAHGGALKGAYRFKSHLLFKWLADLIRAPTILDMVEDLIGPDILCWNTNWFIKEPRSANFVSWHQDNNYWGLDTKKLVSVWIALSPATVMSGCMRLVPGSHVGPTLPHKDTFHQDNMLTRGQEIAVTVDEAKAVDITLDTGEAALFAFGIAHSSPPNQSDDRRIAIVLRYIPPETRQTLSAWDSAALVRGQDRYNHFTHEPLPKGDFDDEAVAFHRRAEEQQRQIYYRDTGVTAHRT